ncbi:MAG: LptE family protein [Desulfuromonadaceae bacterium]|nr:LptE family protein [Desulfuromonadaceae bacterium]MDD5105419.1 LptE family protein [Desulfuromonadaceae bacterium]
MFFRWLRAFLLGLLLLAVAGCGYHFTQAQSGRIGSAQKIWVPFFNNESISPTAQTVLRRAFYDEFHALRGLAPADSALNADLAVKGRVISYSSKAVAFNALDQARLYLLTVVVELEITGKGEVVPLWKGQLQGAQQFPANSDLALQRNSEEQAFAAAARIIAHKCISALEESY